MSKYTVLPDGDTAIAGYAVVAPTNMTTSKGLMAWIREMNWHYRIVWQGELTLSDGRTRGGHRIDVDTGTFGEEDCAGLPEVFGHTLREALGHAVQIIHYYTIGDLDAVKELSYK